MRNSKRKRASSGFSVVEVGLVVVVVVIIGALGYLFYHNTIAKKSSETASSSNSTHKTASVGTTESVDQLTQQEAATESNINSGADSQAVDNANSANGAISNVGGAYDESRL